MNILCINESVELLIIGELDGSLVLSWTSSCVSSILFFLSCRERRDDLRFQVATLIARLLKNMSSAKLRSLWVLDTFHSSALSSFHRSTMPGKSSLLTSLLFCIKFWRSSTHLLNWIFLSMSSSTKNISTSTLFLFYFAIFAAASSSSGSDRCRDS